MSPRLLEPGKPVGKTWQYRKLDHSMSLRFCSTRLGEDEMRGLVNHLGPNDARQKV